MTMLHPSCFAAGAIALALAASGTSQQPAVPRLLDARSSVLPTDDVELTGLASHDFDADGLRDLLVSADWAPGNLRSRLRLLRGTPSGSFEDFDVPTINNGRSFGPVGDFDGDGDADVVIVGNGGSFLLRNDLSSTGRFEFAPVGLGTFSPTVFPFAISANAVAGDLNGDGLDDLVLGGLSPAVRLAQPGSLSGFGPVTQLPTGTLTALPSFGLGDFDIDGDLDLAVANGDRIEILANDGSANFTPAANAAPFLLLGGDTIPLKVRDADLDGLPDLVFGDDSYAAVLQNTGPGGFSFLVSGLPNAVGPGERILDVDATDIDGDGDPELAIASEHGLAVYERSAANRFIRLSALRLPTFESPVGAVLFEDLDADGDADLLFGERTLDFGSLGTQSSLRLGWNNGSGVFAFAPNAVVPERLGRLAHGDIDGDGDADLVDGSGGIHLNDGTGRFTTTTTGDPFLYAFPLLSDFDGDGALDLLLRDGPLLAIRRGDGQGSFTTNPITSLAPTLTPDDRIESVASGDLDGDGDVDLFLSTRFVGAGHTDIVFENTASGFQELQFAATLGDGGPTALGDLDGDGDLDAVSGNTLWENLGGMSFVQSPGFVPFSGTPVDVLIEDLDGDGFADIVLADQTDGFVPDLDDRILWNDPAAPLLSRNPLIGTSIPDTRGTTRGVAKTDLNGDGLSDLVFVYSRIGSALIGGAETRAFLQNGSRQFARLDESLLPLDSGESEGILSFDADRDGDLDVLVINRPNFDEDATPTSRLYLNASRQLRTPHAPRLGRDYDIELYRGSPGSLLGFGTRSVAIPTPFGILGIDPTTLLTAGSFAGVELEVLRIRIPQTQSLLGLRLVWQAFDAAGPRLSNTVVDTVISG